MNQDLLAQDLLQPHNHQVLIFPNLGKVNCSIVHQYFTVFLELMGPYLFVDITKGFGQQFLNLPTSFVI